MVLLINFSQTDFVINDGERIAQMVIAKHENAEFMNERRSMKPERCWWLWSSRCKINIDTYSINLL